MELSQWAQAGQHLTSGLEISQQGGLWPVKEHKWPEERLKACVSGLMCLLESVGCYAAISSCIFPGAAHFAQSYQRGTIEAEEWKIQPWVPQLGCGGGCPFSPQLPAALQNAAVAHLAVVLTGSPWASDFSISLLSERIEHRDHLLV